jgi:hypothetical protein
MLVSGPAVTTGSGHCESHGCELLFRRKIGDFDIDFPRPELTGHLRERWNGALG